MNKLIRGIALAAVALTGAATAVAQTLADKPIIEFKTTLYELNGDANAFHFIIGATDSTYIDVDYGFGLTEVEVGPAVFNPETQAIEATTVSGTVGKDGVVRIYGDASKIDYLDLNGVYITDLEFSALTNLQILDLSHNLLHSLDLSAFSKLQALYIDDNTFDVSPFVLGPDHPDLTILSMSSLGAVDPAFNIGNYPSLASAQIWHNPSITQCDPSGCPDLMQLSLDMTNVSTIDVTKNPKLLILNVSDTRVTSVDLSKNPYLTEFYAGHNGGMNAQYKIKSIDLSANTELQRLMLGGNALESIDVSMLPKLTSLSVQHNLLKTINIDNNPLLASLDVSFNYMNFATLPDYRTTFSEYFYEQNPVPLSTEYATGTVLDFSDSMLRPGSVTDAALFSWNREFPSENRLLDSDYFSWQDGKLTLLKTVESDSCWVAFKNSVLPDATMSTTRFMVKEPDRVGKPSAAVALTFSSSLSDVSFGVGLAGATESAPVKFFVDFGDGTLTEFAATGDKIPAVANVSGKRAGTVTVYLPTDVHITALSVVDQRLLKVDLANAETLRYLTLDGCRLTTIDLKWNKLLCDLNLPGNSLSKLDLAGANGLYQKNFLANINASNNRLSSFNYEAGQAFRVVDLSGNNLTTVPLLKFSNVTDLDLSGNKLTEVDLRDLEAIRNLDLSDNNLTAVTLTDYMPLRSLDLSLNKFTFAALPAHGTLPDYTYAPQKDIVLPAKAPVVSLYDYKFDTAAGQTVYTWLMADGSAVPEGKIRANDGRFFFDDPDLGLVFCTMSNAAFPDFKGDNILKTTVVQTAPMPEHVFGTFTPASDGTVGLVLTGADNNVVVYIDWTGEGDMEQLILKDSYQNFSGKVMAGKQAKFYSYDANDGVTVLSLSSMKFSQADFSTMAGLKAFMIHGGGLTAQQLKLPVASAATLTELALDGNLLTDIDFAKQLPSLSWLIINDNPLSTLDLSVAPRLSILGASGCGLTDIKFNNPLLWDVNLSGNKFKTISFENAPAIDQLFVNNNELESIDVSAIAKLRVLNVDNNRLTFATLPRKTEAMNVYSYQGQAQVPVTAVNGVVDLSSQAKVGDTPTVYRWFIDSPYLDENNILSGEELIEGTEYTIADGVTTFLSPFSHVVCVMTNTEFPDLYLLSEFLDIQLGVDDITVDNDNNAPVEYYDLQGRRVANPRPGTILIRRQGPAATKVLVK